MIRITHSGNFDKVERFLRKPLAFNLFERCGAEGVQMLTSSTPKDSGETATSWSYKVIFNKGSIKIVWENSNVVDGIPVAILIQYGHGTRNGGYVQGRDFINPAMRLVFDKMLNDMWKEITKS